MTIGPAPMIRTDSMSARFGMSVAPGRPKRLTPPPLGAASEASVGVVHYFAPGRPKRLTPPPLGGGAGNSRSTAPRPRHGPVVESRPSASIASVGVVHYFLSISLTNRS